MIKEYRFKMYYDELWRLSPLQKIEDIPNLTKIQNEFNDILDDIKNLIETEKKGKGDIEAKWNASVRLKNFNQQLEEEGILLYGIQSFLRERLGIGIKLSSWLTRLSALTKREISAIDATIGYRKMTDRKAPYNYKELCKLYNLGKISKEDFNKNWLEEERRISIG